jgi:ABC-type lipoprotein export system ATPase subunit
VALNAAFVNSFYGSSDDLFKNDLKTYSAMYNSQHHYGKIVCILQSSGTGKSRLIAEYAKKVGDV